MNILDHHNRNEYFDLGEEVVVTPERNSIKVIDEETYMQRLADIHSPRERLIEFFKSQISLTYEPTHEAVYIRLMGFSGLAFGWLLGGIIRSRHIIQNFQRQNNATAFEGNFRAQRFRSDRYLYAALSRGAKYGIGTGLFCASAGLIGFGSISYRNQLYYPDWLLCFGTLGAVSRCWLGLRGLVFGAGMGLLGGSLGYGFAKAVEVSGGKSVAQLRYLNHMEYLQKRQIKLDRIHRIRAEIDKDKLSSIP